MSSYGVSDSGFVNRRQSDWESDLKASVFTQFGSDTDLGPDTILGQFVSIIAERLALVSEAVQDTYTSQDPAAAEGVAVDYQLALLGLTRDKQRATATNPVPDTTVAGLVLPGLVLYGTPGTTIPAGSIIQTTTLPTLNFTLDAQVTIGVPQSAQQQLVFSQQPTSGAYALNLTAPSGTLLATAALPYNTTAQGVQLAIAGLQDTTGLYPYTDVTVSQTSSQTMAINFGAGTPSSGQPASGALPQSKIITATQTLLAGQTLVNLSVVQSIVGQQPLAIGSATCTQTGPNTVLAHTLSVIGSGQSGWTGVDNPLDCITGADTETDTDAETRRKTALAARGNGTLAGMVAKVLAVSGVTTALAFENTTHAALQNLTFGTTPIGSFSLVVGGQTTSPIAAVPTAATVQAAINAQPGLSTVKVQGSVIYGMTIDYNGAMGGQAQPLAAVINDNSQAGIAIRFGRPPKSYEIVVQGGADTDIARSILASAPSGIASFGAPILTTTGSCTAGSTQVTLQSVTGLLAGQNLTGRGLQSGSIILAINGTQVTLSLAALGTYSSVPMVAQAALQVTDAQGNPHVVAFSRPSETIIYVVCQLITDFYNVPGDPTSGQSATASFNPATLATVQTDLMAAAALTPIGGLLTARGSLGLASAFRDVPGVIDATLAFGLTPQPANAQNIQLLPEQTLSVQSQFVQVSFT